MVCILLLYLYQWVGAFLVRRFDVFRQSSALDIVNGVLSGGGVLLAHQVTKLFAGDKLVEDNR